MVSAAASNAESGMVDPLSALNGPSLFPRTFREALSEAGPIESQDLESINKFMMSLEFKSPEKLVNEAKKILEGGTEFLNSNLVNFSKTSNLGDAFATKIKDMPKEKRQGLGRTRNRAPFSLKNSVSQPSASLEPAWNIDQLKDPDEFFDAYERLENAKKEIQKQLAGNISCINEVKPSTNTRLRRTGILGKSYTYKHRYSSVPFENDISMSSQEDWEHDIPNAPRDGTQAIIDNPEPSLDIDLKGVELAASVKTSGSGVESVLDQLLSCDNEALDGDGALILLQERLKIKPLDLENLCIPEFHDVQGAILSSTERVQKAGRRSFIIENVLKNSNGRQSVDREQEAKNKAAPIASPTPPRSPFASLSLLQKRILQSNPMTDSFSPLNVDLSTHKSACECDPVDELHEHVHGQESSKKAYQLEETHMEAEIVEPTHSCKDSQIIIGGTDGLPSFSDEDACMQSAKPDPRSNVEPDHNHEVTLNFENFNDNESNTSALEDGPTDVTSRKRQSGTAEQLEVHQTRLQRQEAGDESLRNSHRPKRSVSDQSNASVLEDRDSTSRRQNINAAQRTEVNRKKLQGRRRETGVERIKKSHPPRKSLAETGSSFETGLRRSKRIKMRPLQYWKGERLLFGRVDDSFKLIGVKYFSPGKEDGDMKVKPLLSSALPKYKDLLELAARH